jgi:hypothetical protein
VLVVVAPAVVGVLVEVPVPPLPWSPPELHPLINRAVIPAIIAAESFFIKNTSCSSQNSLAVFRIRLCMG